jgi:hypothetical protein
MSYKVNKVIYLLLGMVLGFFVGGGIIWWQIQKKNVSEKETSVRENENSNQTINTNLVGNKLSLKEKYKSQLLKYKIPDTFIDSLKLDSTTLTLEQLIALYQNETIDTSYSASSSDNIVISKDELLFTRLIKVAGQYHNGEDSYELDSVLTDQRDSHKKDQSIIKVEFWRSPINYKGFKFDDVKLVVFGLLEFNNLSLIGHNNNLFIRYNKEYFQIDPTDDFKPLVPVKNNVLIKELNSL